MRNSSASKVKLESYDSLFGNTDLPKIERVVKESDIKEVALTDLIPFENHPFKVLDNKDMDDLVESIKENGVLVPALARPLKNGKYELISGHRRKRASELAGLTKMPVIIKELSDDDSIVYMVDANLQREEILPSEKAFAYKLKFEALKHKGVKQESSSYEQVGASTGESGKTVQRYICLTRLLPELLDMVDVKALGFVQGVDISFLNEEQQMWVIENIIENKTNISKEQSNKLKEFGKKNELTKAMVYLILSNEKKTKQRKVVIKADKLQKYFAEDMSEGEIEDIIFSLLEEWNNRQ